MVRFSEKSKKTQIYLEKPTNNSFEFSKIPTFIFQDRRLTPLEALIKFYRENKGLSYHAISKILNRHVRDVYKAYANAFDKSFDKKFHYNYDNSIHIPISIFKETDLSALEAICFYLKSDLKFSYHQIAVLLNRNERTIWTIFARALKKNDS